MPDPTPITSDGVNMINATMTGLTTIAATIMGGLTLKRAKEDKDRKDSRELIREMACKLDGLCNTAAVVTTDLAVVRNDVATVKSQNTELFQRVRAAEQNAAVALDRTEHKDKRSER
jgi:hypothetical protein